MSNKKQYAFYFDQTRCMACNVCTVACKDWNQIEPGLVNWRTQFTYERGDDFFPVSMGCNHCEDPACVDACNAQAIYKDEATGIVMIDRSKCLNILACIDACPFSKPKIADDRQEPHPLKGWQKRHPAQKCTMCSDTKKLDEGEKPACVTACVGRALDFGTIESLAIKYPDAVRLNPTDFPEVYVNNTNDTAPAFFIKRRTEKLTVHRASQSSYKG